MYEKYVPQAVREYIESRGDVPSEIRKANKKQVRSSGDPEVAVKEQI